MLSRNAGKDDGSFDLWGYGTFYLVLPPVSPPSFPLSQQAARCACQLQLPVAKNSEVKAA